MSREAPPPEGHNSGTTAEAREALKGYVARAESILGDIDDRKSDLRELYKEAKDNGFDSEALKAVLAQQRRTEEQNEKRRRKQEMVDKYLLALGLFD
jgi:uncharacterized protein (UPF0335 family)